MWSFHSTAEILRLSPAPPKVVAAFSVAAFTFSSTPGATILWPLSRVAARGIVSSPSGIGVLPAEPYMDVLNKPGCFGSGSRRAFGIIMGHRGGSKFRSRGGLRDEVAPSGNRRLRSALHSTIPLGNAVDPPPRSRPGPAGSESLPPQCGRADHHRRCHIVR
jgi:hypothetical protein